MKDAISPKMRQQLIDSGLVPDGVEALVPKCVVCSSPIPKGRANIKTRYTCKPACALAMKAKTLQLRQLRECVACRHPSTPKEREEFEQWRRHRGDLGVNPVGKPPVKRVKLLEDSLRQATALLQHAMAINARGTGVNWDEGSEAIEKFQNLLDAKRPNGSTLAASGETARESQGDEHHAI